MKLDDEYVDSLHATARIPLKGLNFVIEFFAPREIDINSLCFKLEGAVSKYQHEILVPHLRMAESLTPEQLEFRRAHEMRAMPSDLYHSYQGEEAKIKEHYEILKKRHGHGLHHH